jgi:tetratricopeptide (TPR) repeat protein
MDPQSGAVAERDFQRALQELADGNALAALACLEKALKVWDDPRWYAYLGFCIAKERGQLTKGFGLCRTAIENEPENCENYLLLSKVHMLAGQKEEALEALRQGMAHGGNPEIERLLNEIGTRKPPPISFLSRDNLINKYLGIIQGRLGLR